MMTTIYILQLLSLQILLGLWLSKQQVSKGVFFMENVKRFQSATGIFAPTSSLL